MKKTDLRYLCTAIGNQSGIPIRLYEGERQVFCHSPVSLPRDPMEVCREEIWGVHAHVGYFVTGQFHYYGIVNSGRTKIVAGPTRQVEDNDQELRELAFRADVPAGEVEDFVAGMKGIARMPLESVLQMLCTVNYILNDEKLGLEDVAIHESEQNDLKTLLEQQRSSRAFSGEPAGLQTQSNAHSTYALEQTMLRMVRKGDTAALKKWIASAPAVSGGTLASDQIRQVKNIFVVSATLVSRAAIHGGMDAQDAFALSDAYIRKCELLNAMERISNLQYHMVLEFAQRVERLRFGKQPTQLTLAVANYIRHHLSEPITAQAIAKELFISRPYLSARFREETGETLTDFILKEKTEEAKRLLRYTDKTAAAIGAYLGFSSQSHFSRVFRKYTGKTPMEYRGEYMT